LYLEPVQAHGTTLITIRLAGHRAKMVNDKSEAIIIATSIFLALSLIAVGLRCYVRIRLIRAFGADDWAMVLAVAFNLAFAVCGILGGLTGLGKKLGYFADKPEDLRNALRV
jgi:hypothetical protein